LELERKMTDKATEFKRIITDVKNELIVKLAKVTAEIAKDPQMTKKVTKGLIEECMEGVNGALKTLEESGPDALGDCAWAVKQKLKAAKDFDAEGKIKWRLTRHDYMRLKETFEAFLYKYYPKLKAKMDTNLSKCKTEKKKELVTIQLELLEQDRVRAVNNLERAERTGMFIDSVFEVEAHGSRLYFRPSMFRQTWSVVDHLDLYLTDAEAELDARKERAETTKALSETHAMCVSFIDTVKDLDSVIGGVENVVDPLKAAVDQLDSRVSEARDFLDLYAGLDKSTGYTQENAKEFKTRMKPAFLRWNVKRTIEEAITKLQVINDSIQMTPLMKEQGLKEEAEQYEAIKGDGEPAVDAKEEEEEEDEEEEEEDEEEEEEEDGARKKQRVE
jgi:hypothetical protein